MEFTFETHYNLKALTIMAKALRKTIRKKHNRHSRIFAWLIIALGLLCIIIEPALDFRTILTLAAVLILFAVLILEDRLNGFVAQKRMLSGTEKAVTTFSEKSYFSSTEIGKTEWNYDKIIMLAETADFFVFIFSKSHAQLYDKSSIKGGSADDFRNFIEAATQKQIQPIK
ncbi:MAG: YcxB family protein [Oscillospiraceae bacterium]|nr:YcxB family protein [Oscillospiraceae bacterium]